MFGSEQRKARILFALSDVFLTALAFAIAYQIRLWLRLDLEFAIPVHVKALLLGFSCLAWLSVGFWRNVYGKLDSARIRVILGDSFRQAAYSGLALIVLVFALKLQTSRAFLGLFIALSWILVVAWRMGARNLVPVVRREFGVLRYVLIVGVGERAQRLARHLEEYHDHGLRILGFMKTAGETAPHTLHFERTYRVFPVEELSLMLRKQVVDEVFFAVESEKLASLEEIFLLCDDEGVCSRLAVDYFPHVNSRVTLERLDQTPLLTFSAAPDDQVLLLAKRAIDLGVAALARLLHGGAFRGDARLVREDPLQRAELHRRQRVIDRGRLVLARHRLARQLARFRVAMGDVVAQARQKHEERRGELARPLRSSSPAASRSWQTASSIRSDGRRGRSRRRSRVERAALTLPPKHPSRHRTVR